MSDIHLAGAHVLVLEDNALISLDLEQMLENLGAGSVSIARSVEDALDILGAGDVGLAIIDVVIGDEDSADVAKMLRDQTVPFVVASGYGEEKLSNAHFAGTARLSKPFTEDDLVEALQSAGVIAG